MLPLRHRFHVRAHALRYVRARPVKSVFIAQQENHRIECEDPLHQQRQILHKSGGILMQHHLLAQRVKPLHIFTALLRLLRLPPRPVSHSAHHQAAGYKTGHRHPFLPSRQQQRVIRLEKEKIE